MTSIFEDISFALAFGLRVPIAMASDQERPDLTEGTVIYNRLFQTQDF